MVERVWWDHRSSHTDKTRKVSKLPRVGRRENSFGGYRGEGRGIKSVSHMSLL